MGLFNWFRRPQPSVPRPLSPERRREVTAWLRHPITAEAALGKAAEFYRRLKSPDHGAVRALQHWLENHMRPGDELWWYDTGGDSWANLCGEEGFALLRDGQVADVYLWAMN